VGADATVDLLRQLVGFDTTSHRSNLPLVDFVAGLLDRPGVAVHRNLAPDGTKANLLAVLGPGLDERRRGLVLAGHTDTVPADEPGWSSDPFTLSEREGSVYARGAADMKGFVALALELAQRVDLARLRHPLVVLLTYDEELGALGAAHLVDTWDHAGAPLPRAAVVGEPTELRVVGMHKGHVKLAVEVPGRSAHSAYAHLGDNAIVRAARVVGSLAAFGAELAARRLPASVHFPDAPGPTLNVGTIRGGSAINVVPDRCRLEVGVRMLPGMRGAEVLAEVRQRVQAEPPGDTVEVLSDTAPMRCPDGAAARRELLALTGQRETVAVHYASDAGELQRAGVEAVLWGPGSIEVAHRPDEHLPLAELARAGVVLERLVERLCVAPEPVASGGPG
jgi:acetylornithine deacetylase